MKTVLALELVLTRSIAGCISNNGVRKSEVCRVRRRLVPRRVQFLFPIRLVAYYFSLLKADVGQLKHLACRPITLSLSFTKRVTCHILKGPGRKGRKRDRMKSSFRYGGTMGLLTQIVKLIISEMMPSFFTDSYLLSERLQHKPSLLHLLRNGF